jgi:hypothetical protein
MACWTCCKLLGARLRLAEYIQLSGNLKEPHSKSKRPNQESVQLLREKTVCVELQRTCNKKLMSMSKFTLFRRKQPLVRASMKGYYIRVRPLEVIVWILPNSTCRTRRRYVFSHAFWGNVAYSKTDN